MNTFFFKEMNTFFFKEARLLQTDDKFCYPRGKYG